MDEFITIEDENGEIRTLKRSRPQGAGTCQHCGTEFIDRKKRKNNNFCSPHCELVVTLDRLIDAVNGGLAEIRDTIHDHD